MTGGVGAVFCHHSESEVLQVARAGRLCHLEYLRPGVVGRLVLRGSDRVGEGVRDAFDPAALGMVIYGTTSTSRGCSGC